MWWDCPLTHDARWRYFNASSLPRGGGDDLPAEARELWSDRALLPTCLNGSLKPPRRDDAVHWERWPRSGFVEGTVYTDGSGLRGSHPRAARAGWGFVSSREDGTCLNAAACGPLPTFTQTVGCAEIYAAAMALRHPAPLQPITIATDYARLVKGWERGAHAYTGPRSRCAEAWKAFWHSAIDFGLQYIQVRKVPAHRPYSDVVAGRLQFCDWYGNQQADLMARQGAAMHPCNAELVSDEDRNSTAQYQQGHYIAWVNALLQWSEANQEWYQPELSEWWTTLLRASEGCASTGVSGKAGFDRAPEPQRGDPPHPAMGDSAGRGTPAEGEDVPTASVFRETSPEEQASRDGIHPTHVPYQTTRYTFCGICGTYGKHLKKTQLHKECPRKPKNRWATAGISRLMTGLEPDGLDTQRRATPYFAE